MALLGKGIIALLSAIVVGGAFNVVSVTSASALQQWEAYVASDCLEGGPDVWDGFSFTANSWVINTGDVSIDVVVSLTGNSTVSTTLLPDQSVDLNVFLTDSDVWAGSVSVNGDIVTSDGGRVNCPGDGPSTYPSSGYLATIVDTCSDDGTSTFTAIVVNFDPEPISVALTMAGEPSVSTVLLTEQSAVLAGTFDEGDPYTSTITVDDMLIQDIDGVVDCDGGGDPVESFSTDISGNCFLGVFTATAGVTNTGSEPIVVSIEFEAYGLETFTVLAGDEGSLSFTFDDGDAWFATIIVNGETVDSGGGAVDCPPISGGEPDVDRIAGSDRFATAAEVARQYQPFESGHGVVYVANGLNFPDALSAAPAAAFQEAPLLLSRQNELPTVTREQIERLNPQLIVIAGGTGVVSTAVENELRTLAPEVRRDAGANRYETSRVLTERAFGEAGAQTVFLATGRGFPDALSASAAAGQLSAPVLLVDGSRSTIDDATVALLDDLGATQVFIAGGTGVMSTGIQTFVSGLPFVESVTRLAGADRYSTSQAINGAVFANATTVYLAVGTGFADALAGAALAGKVGSPLFVVPGNCVPNGVLTKITALGATDVVLLGGVGALSAQVANLTRC